MANKPFAIQGADLTLGGVNLQAGTTGVVIPGVTQATNYRAEEVEDFGGDDTNVWQDIPVVIDQETYNRLAGIINLNDGWIAPTYEVEELDDDGKIDGIKVTYAGSIPDETVVAHMTDNMFAAPAGSSIDPQTFDSNIWVAIPYYVKCRAGEVENIGGGNANTGDFIFEDNFLSVDGADQLVIQGETDGDARIDIPNNNRAENDKALEIKNYGAQGVKVITGQNGTNEWSFNDAGGLQFPDGSTQTTAYTGQSGGGSTAVSKFVMVNFDGGVYGSDNGVDWTGPFNTGIGTLSRVAVGPDMVVYTGGNPGPFGTSVYYTTAWNVTPTLVEDPAPSTWNQVRYFASINKFVAVGSIDGTPSYKHSTDGINWTTVSLDNPWASALNGGDGYGQAYFTDIAYNGTGFLLTTNSTILGSFYTTTLTTNSIIGVGEWLNDGMDFSRVVYSTGMFTGWFAFGNGNTAAGDGWWANSSVNPSGGSFTTGWGISDISQEFFDAVNYNPGWSEIIIGRPTGAGIDTIMIGTDDGQILYWPTEPAGPYVSIPKPYTSAIADIVRGTTTTILINGGETPAADGEKITISGVTSFDASEPGTSNQSYNGTFYIKNNSGSLELYTDTGLTVPWDTTTYWPVNTGTGTLTWSHGQYIDALGFAGGKFYAGNDNEEIFVSENGGATWTEVAALNPQGGEGGQGSGTAYMNDIDGFVGDAVIYQLVNGENSFTLNLDGSISLPTLSVNLHNGGNQQGQVLQFGDTQQAIITGPTPANGSNAERLIIQGQAATGNGEGGDVYFWAGDAPHYGGDIKIYAGDADSGTVGDDGGYINIQGGSGYSNGGDVTIRGGNSTISPGTVYIYSGSNQWRFDNNGDLVLPSGGDIKDANGVTVLGGAGGGAELVGDSYVAGTGFKHVVYTDYQGYQGGESNGVLVAGSDVFGIQVGDTITFRNGEVRTITSFDTGYDPQVYVQWADSVDGSWDNPRFPMTFTSANYVAETKSTARIKPDDFLVGSGQYMEVYAGGPTVVDQKHIHMAGANADTELFLGTDNNFVSAKEAGLSPARVNLKSENDITVSDTNLRMSRGNTWVSVYGDGINRNQHGGTYDLTWNVIESDDQGNFYVGGESCAYAEAMVAKYGPDGDLLWTKLVNGDSLNGWQLDGVAYNPVDKEVAVAVQTNANRNNNYYKINVLDSESGDFKSVFDLYDADGEINIHNMTWHSTLGWIAVGYTHGETGSTSPITATGATGVGVIELPVASVKVGGQWPDRNSGTWSISGTNITGSQILQGAGLGLYQNVPVINLTNPSDTGLTVGIRVDYQNNYYDYVTTNTSGTGVWAFNDNFKILGSNLGGFDGGTNISAVPSSATPGSGTVSLFFDKSTYPDLYNQLRACSWTLGYNEGGPYSINSLNDTGTMIEVNIPGSDTTISEVIFNTAQGNDITGFVADLNGIQLGYSGVPNIYGLYRIDMGYTMGYGSTDFTGGTFTISSVLDNLPFVWTEKGDWNKIYKPADGVSTGSATCVTVHKLSGDIIVGGRDSTNGRGFVWKLDASGNTAWVKGIDDDTNQVCSVAVSEVNGGIYYTTNYNSVNKLDSLGNLVKRVEPNGMWSMSNPIVKLEQGLDGAEHLYVAGQFSAIWTMNSGFMVTKLSSDLRIMWTREFWNENRYLNDEYDMFHNNVALGRDKIVLVGYTYLGSFNNANAYLASISTGDTFEPVQLGDWHLDIPGGDIQYNDQTNNYSIYDFSSNGASTSNGSLSVAIDNGAHEWTNWAWKSTTLRLDHDKGIKGVESIHFAEGGKLDHNPADIPPVLTDFNQSWNYTLQLSDRGKFIINSPTPDDYTNHLYITVPSNTNVSFPVGSVITLINTSNPNTNGYRIYVQPENWSNSSSPRIYATDGSSNYSTWSFQGIQTATLMKIGSNEWLLTANNISNED